MDLISRPAKERLTATSVLDLPSVLVIAAASVALALPMLIYGPMPWGNDTYQHLNFAKYFSEQFWAGDWYPRWLIGMCHGLGSPTLFIYPPFPSYVVALFVPLGKVLHFDAFKMGEFLALFGSGICAFLWLRTMASRGVALLCAALYLMMPFHLAIDFYRRDALAECWALVWMPLILYFTAKTVERGGVYLLGLGVAYALLIVSHLVAVFLFSLIPLALALFLAPRGKEFRSLLRVSEGMLLGIGLSCFYLIAALAHNRYFTLTVIPDWSTRADRHLLDLGTLLHRVGINHTISVIVFDMVALCIVCSATILAKGSPEWKKRVLFWLLPCAVSVFLMLSLSSWLWRVGPLLHTSVRYPGRLNLILCVGSLPILAALFSEIPRLPRFSQGLLVVLLLAGIVPWLVWYRAVWISYPEQTPPPTTVVSDFDGFFFTWPAPGTDQESALEASTKPPARFLTGAGTAKAVLWEPRHIEIETNSPSGGEVLVNQFYYPPWRAILTGENRQIKVEAEIPAGIVKLRVPAGPQHVRLEIPVGPTEYIGQWISGICVFLTLGLAAKSHLTVRRETAAASAPVEYQ
ncbi:MAG TPA: 6-pyruvoyl-tetrahydropterin synthase-related protein [Verrucomicrobiae bacterium]|nr:6-pyruvoyl-tetrahydropterin synthase-related protein [Verrucomicrobiae bacterium]